MRSFYTCRSQTQALRTPKGRVSPLDPEACASFIRRWGGRYAKNPQHERGNSLAGGLLQTVHVLRFQCLTV